MMMCHLIVFRIINVSNESYRRSQNTRYMFCILLFGKYCRLWDTVEKCGRARQATDDNIIRRMRFACWITKVETHAQYVILIAFALQNWLLERVWMLRIHTQGLSFYISFFTVYRKPHWYYSQPSTQVIDHIFFISWLLTCFDLPIFRNTTLNITYSYSSLYIRLKCIEVCFYVN